MTKIRFEMRRVLFVNGVRVRLKGLTGITSPTMGLLEELEACHVSGTPWGKFWIEDFTVKSVIEEDDMYNRYDAKLVSQKALIG